VGEAVPVDLDSDGDVDGAGFLLWGQSPVQAVVAQGVVENVNIDGQHMVIAVMRVAAAWWARLGFSQRTTWPLTSSTCLQNSSGR
jgi:hypothetical protein